VQTSYRFYSADGRGSISLPHIFLTVDCVPLQVVSQDFEVGRSFQGSLVVVVSLPGGGHSRFGAHSLITLLSSGLPSSEAQGGAVTLSIVSTTVDLAAFSDGVPHEQSTPSGLFRYSPDHLLVPAIGRGLLASYGILRAKPSAGCSLVVSLLGTISARVPPSDHGHRSLSAPSFPLVIAFSHFEDPDVSMGRKWADAISWNSIIADFLAMALSVSRSRVASNPLFSSDPVSFFFYPERFFFLPIVTPT